MCVVGMRVGYPLVVGGSHTPSCLLCATPPLVGPLLVSGPGHTENRRKFFDSNDLRLWGGVLYHTRGLPWGWSCRRVAMKKTSKKIVIRSSLPLAIVESYGIIQVDTTPHHPHKETKHGHL